MSRVGLAFALVAALAAAPRSTRAAEWMAQDDDDKLLAHVTAARSASAGGDHRRAIKEYQAGYEVAKRPELLILIALEYQEIGGRHFVRRYLRQFLKEAPSDHRRREEAKAMLARLEREKGRITSADSNGNGEAVAGSSGGGSGNGSGNGSGGGSPRGAKVASANDTPVMTFQPDTITRQAEDTERPESTNLSASPSIASQRNLLVERSARARPVDDADPPFYSRWWFWTVSAFLAGGAIGLAIVATQSSGPRIRPCPYDVIGCFGDGR